MRTHYLRLVLLVALLLGTTLWSSTRFDAVEAAAVPLAPAPNETHFDANDASGAYCSSGVLTIPDNDPTGVSGTITVADSATITDLNVSLDVTHSWVGDLRFTLSHGATTAELYDRPGVPASTFGCSGDDFNVTADDEGATSFEAACENNTPAYPTGGRYIPGDPAGPNLAAFDGQNINGVWTFNAFDEAGGDTGTVNQWCLITDGGTGPTPTPTTTLTPTVTRTPTATPSPTATPNAPDIEVAPASVSETHNSPPQSTTRILLIGNPGSAPLTWTITEAGVIVPAPAAPTKQDETAGTASAPTAATALACDMPADLPWLTVSPTNGTTAPGGSSNVTLTFDSTGLSGGPHTGNLCVASNDPDEPLTTVPVTLNVNLPTAVEVGTFTRTQGGSRIAEIAAAGVLLLAAVGFLLKRK